jgi:hypothetical protein
MEMESGRRLSVAVSTFYFSPFSFLESTILSLLSGRLLGRGSTLSMRSTLFVGDASSRTELVVLPATSFSCGREVIEEIRRQREADIHEGRRGSCRQTSSDMPDV